MLDFPAMNATRAYLPLLAKLLIVLVILNGLACGVGHGQMLSPLFEPGPRQAAPEQGQRHGAMHDMAGMADTANAALSKEAAPPMPGMNSPFGDCFFAGSLPSLLLTFALIGWLLRSRAQRPKLPAVRLHTVPRAVLPNLNPRAP